MATLGPFGARREVVAAVSGGADSVALAWLLRRWGAPLAVVVDHGLRAESAVEAAVTLERLAGMGVAGRLVRLEGLRAGANLGARARAARYAALLAVCRETGRPDLLVGHHRQDQLETVALRRARGSGAAGLAGMAAVSWRGDGRIVRPLLTVWPERLRTTLVAAGVGWVEDPTNQDRSTARGALRAVPGRLRAEAGDGEAGEGKAGAARSVAEDRVARELGVAVAVYPTGHAVVAGALSAEAAGALVWTVSGRAYPPSAVVSGRVVRTGGTVHGVVCRGGLVVREEAGLGAEVAAGACWDGRFAVRAGGAAAGVGPLGADAARLRRRSGFPSAVMRPSPAVRLGVELFMSPHLAYHGDETWLSVQVDFRPPRLLAGAPFWPAVAPGVVGEGAGDEHGAETPHVVRDQGASASSWQAPGRRPGCDGTAGNE